MSPMLGCPNAFLAFQTANTLLSSLWGLAHSCAPLPFSLGRAGPEWAPSHTGLGAAPGHGGSLLTHSPLPAVTTEPISEDTVRSELLIPAARPADAGNYTCTAANFLGNTSVAINLRVVAPWA